MANDADVHGTVASTNPPAEQPAKEKNVGDEGEDALYVVEEILAKRVKNNKVEYKVKWEGYDLIEATWQTADDLTNCGLVIEQFEIKLREKRELKRLKSTAETLTTENAIPSEGRSSQPPETKLPVPESSPNLPDSTVGHSGKAKGKTHNPSGSQISNGHELPQDNLSTEKKLSVSQKRKRQNGLSVPFEEIPGMQVGQSEAVLTTPSKTGTAKKRQKTREVIPTPGPCAEERLQASSSPEIGVAGTVERAEVSRLLTPIMHPDWFRPNPLSTKTPSTSKVLSKVKRDAVTTPKNNKKVGVPVYEFTDEERHLLELRRLAPRVIAFLGLVKNVGEDSPRVVVGISGENGRPSFSQAFPLPVVREILPSKLLDYYESCIQFE